MTRKQQQTHDIDTLLAQAATEDIDLPEGLAARVLEDAARHQPAPRAIRHLRPVTPFWRSRSSWGALGGMVAASCVGFWIGFNPPAAMYETGMPGFALLDTSYGVDAAEISGFGWDLEES